MTGSQTLGRRIVLAGRPDGEPDASNFRLEQVELPVMPQGGVLVRARYLSLDPYMRGRMDDRRSYAASAEIGGVMPGETVAEVLDSDRADLRPGDYVLAQTGWQTHFASDGAEMRKIDGGSLPLTVYLGALGMPGFTAYSGLAEIGRPAAGETLVVAAANGPVGSMVGQLAKLAGARTVGIAGGAEKCAALLETFGFDAAIDHRSATFAQDLAAACPSGIDVYFENVGGAVWQAILPLLNRFARVPVCGLIAQYSGAKTAGGELEATMRAVLTKSLSMRGFINYEFTDRLFARFTGEIAPHLEAGRIRYSEDVTKGLENAPDAFIAMLKGGNTGKAVVDLG